MRLLGWKCQGIENSLIVRALSDLSKSKNPSVIFFSKTKCSSEGICKKLHLFKDWKMEYVDVVGQSGGLVVMWKKEVDVKVIDKSSRYIEHELNDSFVNKS